MRWCRSWGSRGGGLWLRFDSSPGGERLRRTGERCIRGAAAAAFLSDAVKNAAAHHCLLGERRHLLQPLHVQIWPVRLAAALLQPLSFSLRRALRREQRGSSARWRRSRGRRRAWTAAGSRRRAWMRRSRGPRLRLVVILLLSTQGELQREGVGPPICAG
ncbi:unnamed protein product [Urochloa humidicola]